MIISCKCGLQFEVNKKDIPKEGRNVQCGVCNATWFQKPFEKITKSDLNISTTHYFANLILFCLLIVSFLGIMETFREDLLYNFPQLDTYYKIIENLTNNAYEEFRNLLNRFSI